MDYKIGIYNNYKKYLSITTKVFHVYKHLHSNELSRSSEISYHLDTMKCRWLDETLHWEQSTSLRIMWK